MNANMNNGQNPGPQQIVASALAAKYSSKGEIWRFLFSEAEFYLPPYATCNIWWLKELAGGIKKASFNIFHKLFIAYLLPRCLGHQRSPI